MDTFIRESAKIWVKSYRFDIAKIVISGDIPDDLIGDTIIRYDPTYDFTADELKYAIDEVEYASAIILNHVYNLVQAGKAIKDGDDYIIPNDELISLEIKYTDELNENNL